VLVIMRPKDKRFNRGWKSHCPYCGDAVGWLGNWMAYLFGNRIHDCNFKLYWRRVNEDW
jgi:hypothetical protein